MERAEGQEVEARHVLERWKGGFVDGTGERDNVCGHDKGSALL